MKREMTPSEGDKFTLDDCLGNTANGLEEDPNQLTHGQISQFETLKHKNDIKISHLKPLLLP
jgi:hypothetical protein